MQTARSRSIRSAARALALALVAGALAAPSAAWAQAQDSDQQKCINSMVKAAVKQAKTQGKVDDACVEAGIYDDVAALGTAGVHELTTDACLTNDPKGKLAKGIQKGADAETKSCTVAPDFGLAGGATAASAGGASARNIVRDLFGANANQITRDMTYDDNNAKLCQIALTEGTTAIHNAMWKEAASGAKALLAGKNVSQVINGGQLVDGMLDGFVNDDVKGKIAAAITAMTTEVTATCGATAQPFLEILRGPCATSANAADLATCATTATRCRLCRGVSGALGEAYDCDFFDDTLSNDTCGGFADAHEITDSGELLEGPLADGMVGDFMMQNDLARFVIQRANVRDMYSVGGFGGNIIDAELTSNPGKDNFLEIQSALNVETVLNATSLEIVNDGADGGAAVIRVCGPDDILDFVNPSTVAASMGFNFPAAANDVDQPVEACTTYTLEPDATYVKMVTTVTNTSGATIRMFVGDYVNAAGELEQWANGSPGIGPELTQNMTVLSYFGFGEAQGVDYAVATLEVPGLGQTSYFSTNGVSVILQSQSVIDVLTGQPSDFTVTAGGSKSYTRYFGVGDGSGANGITLENIIKAKEAGTLEGCITVDGVPAPGARVSAGTPAAGPITSVKSTWVTDANGCYSGTLPVGNYGVAAWREGTPYEGGGSTPTVHSVSVTHGGTTSQDIDLPQTGHLSVTVVDENSDATPARVTVVGFDPSPDTILAANTGLFRDQTDVVPFGITRAMYTDSTGAVDFDVEPGNYRVYVSRGMEWSAFDQAVTITAGGTTNVSAQIARVIDSTGFISSDHHVHAIASADSRVSNADRVRQFAGEGIDNIIITDHHSHTDLQPKIDDLGFTAFVGTIIGEEITTWDVGHYNGYPFTIDATRPSGGSTDWGGAEAAGTDFPSLGAYTLTPAEVETLAKTQPTATPDTVMQINHIDSHFVPLEIDTSAIPPQSNASPAELLDFRMDPAAGNVFNMFDALELWNGYNRNHQSQFLDERIGIWMNLLNQGLITTAIADTDTHKFFNLETAGGQSFCAASSDDPALFSDSEIAQSVAAGRCTGGQGVYVQTRLVDIAMPANQAGLGIADSNLLAVSNPVTGFNLEIEVQAPIWAEFDRIEVYANASTFDSPTSTEPELFSATPTLVLDAGVDFTITTNNVAPLVTGGSRLEATVTVPFTSQTEDKWIVVVVKGRDGVSAPMFPMYPADIDEGSNTTLANLIDGNLGEDGVTALGFTNALFSDVDGNPGFDAPLP